MQKYFPTHSHFVYENTGIGHVVKTTQTGSSHKQRDRKLIPKSCYFFKDAHNTFYYYSTGVEYMAMFNLDTNVELCI